MKFIDGSVWIGIESTKEKKYWDLKTFDASQRPQQADHIRKLRKILSEHKGHPFRVKHQPIIVVSRLRESEG